MSGTRYRPHRLGVVGLYEYADQVFSAEEGRLALRGRNTSGKSKALELLIPFVLDGDITPRKLDPFATSAKTMRWNLIDCTDAYPERRANKRIGYVWAEFRALDGDGAETFLTCGIGLEATRHGDGVKDRWYFTTAQRVGAQLQLTRAVGDGESQPVVKTDLASQLAAGGGALHDGPTAYKEALRAQLLPFATAELYEQTLEVIRQLRKPKLSDSLNATRLSAMLSQALPTVDEQLVRKLGDALEQLHELQRQHDDLRAARGLVESLVQRECRAYARGVLAQRGARLRRAASDYDARRSAARDAAAACELAVAAHARAERDAEALAARYSRLDGEHMALVTSPAFKVIALLEDRRRERDEAAARASRADEALALARGRVDAARAREEAARAAAAACDGRLREAAARLAETLAPAGIGAPESTRRALQALPARLAVRADDVARAVTLASDLHEVERTLSVLAGPLAAASQKRDAAASRLAEAEAQVELALDGFDAALEQWAGGLTELEVDEEALSALVERAAAGEDLAPLTAQMAAPRAARLAERRAQLRARRQALDEQVEDARAELRGLEAQRDPEPPTRRARPADRSARRGAPLWAVCDFRPELATPERAALEAALEDAGVLDAWISADGTIHDADVTLVAEPGATGGSLADLLVADPGERWLPAHAIDAVLRSLPLDGPISVGPGRFRFGPLHGRAGKAEPEFIGAAARAARRARLIDAARAAVARLVQQRGALLADDEQAEAAQRRLAGEQAAVPSTDALRSAQRLLRRSNDRLADAESHLAGYIADRDRHEQTRGATQAALVEHARATALPADPTELASVQGALDRATLDHARTLDALAATEAEAARVETARVDVTASEDAFAVAAEDRQQACQQFETAEGRLAAAQAADGASAEQLAQRAQALRAEREAVDAQRRSAETALRARIAELKDAERAGDDAQLAVRHAEAERVAALEDVRRLGALELFSAALGAEHAPDERAAASWTLTAALEHVRALPSDGAGVDLAARARRVSDAVSHLQRRLSQFDMDVATIHEHDLTLVEVMRDGRRASPVAMLADLEGDLEHREQVLSAKRREVLGRALLGEIAEHLRTRITAVGASVRSRNAALRRCATGAGRTISLSWDVDEDAGAPPAVLELLRGRGAEHLSERDRDALYAFLEQRIADARAGAEDEAGQTAITDHLSVALDYRRWWRFTLHVHERDGTTRRLTARTQGLGSGGEQSVLMHLPLFATAAALYDLAPQAPRIIALDEAMDGIDPITREQLFALLVELDLDWVMTSYDLNPCVATVPCAGFYELHRDNAEWGVWAQHFVWDGRQVVEVVDG